MGKPLHQMDEEARAQLRAQHVGFVFQSFMLIPTLNALENVELPALLRGENSGQSKAGAKALLEQLGLGKRLDHLPAQLSGGEQQRVALARALTGVLMCCLPMSRRATLTVRPEIKSPTCYFRLTANTAPR